MRFVIPLLLMLVIVLCVTGSEHNKCSNVWEFFCAKILGGSLHADENSLNKEETEQVPFSEQYKLYPPERWRDESPISFFENLSHVYFNLPSPFSYVPTLEQLAGLSVWSLRFQFDPSWNTVVTDPFCGYNSGELLLGNGGLAYEIQYNKKLHFLSYTTDKVFFDMAGFHDLLNESCAKEVKILGNILPHPFYGVLCGVEKAESLMPKPPSGQIPPRHLPWVVITISKREAGNFAPLYAQSLSLAKNLYEIEKIGICFSGRKAFSEWQKALENIDQEDDGEEYLAQAGFCNTWLLLSLLKARELAAEYISKFQKQFDYDKESLQKLAELYSEEAELLRSVNDCFLPLSQCLATSEWTPEIRKRQVEAIRLVTEIEEKIYFILADLVY